MAVHHNSSSVPCYPAREAVSNGALQGDNPTHFALPLLIIQIAIVLLITRTLAFLIKPFRQPRVLAEVIGGVLLGPSGLGRNKLYLNTIFPKQSLTLIDTTATLGLLFFMFMVGLELDLHEIRKSGKTCLIVAFSGISLPFIAGIGVARLIHQSLSIESKFAPFLVFTGVPLCITAFPVLVRIMAERKLLSTELGKKAIPAAAINDVCAWVLLAVGVAISGPSTSPAVPVYVLLAGVGYVLFMLFVTRRVMERIARKSSGQETVSEVVVCVTMVGVLVAGFTTDAIGIHPLFGAFVFGMIMPKEGNFAQILTEKIEDFVTVLMLPLFFASSGLKTNLGSIDSVRGFGFLILLICTAAFGKIFATVLAALWLKMRLREAFAFAFLMNTKGLVELIVLNIGKDLGVFDDQTFAILVLMCLFLMFFTTPAVIALYKPAKIPGPYTQRKLEGSHSKKYELRILACIHGTQIIPALLNVVEVCRGTKKHALKLFVMRLIEFSDRTSSIMSLSRARKYGSWSSYSKDNTCLALETFGRLTKVPVRFLTTISELSDMHDDICSTAFEKRVTMIILPFNSYQGEDGSLEYNNKGFTMVNQKVLQHAPCTVGILVDKGLCSSDEPMETISHKVAVIFFGGPDDREALAFGCRLAEHPNVKLWVLRFLAVHDQTNITTSISRQVSGNDPTHSVSSTGGSQPTAPQDSTIATAKSEETLDEESLASVKVFKGDNKDSTGSSIFYEEYSYSNPAETVVTTTKYGEFSLILVGRGHLSRGLHHSQKHSENSELGLIGDALAMASGNNKASILVIQQHNSSSKLADENALNV